MRFLSRFINTSADENEDGWLSEDEGEDASNEKGSSIGKAAFLGKAAFIRRSMMKLLKRNQSVEGDDDGLAGDLEEFSNSIAAGLGSDANTVSLLAAEVSGPLETISGGPAGDQAVDPPLSSSASPTPVSIVDDSDVELADAKAMDETESAMPEKDATDAADRESIPAPAGDTRESTPLEPTATPDVENDPGEFDLFGSDIFAEELPENSGLRALAESLDEVDAAELAVELRTFVDDLQNR